MKYKEFVRIERIKRILDIVAYGSLGIDIALAFFTLISLNMYSKELSKIVYLLNISLIFEVAFTLVLFVSLAYLYHYEKITDNLASFSRMLTGKRYGKRRSKSYFMCSFKYYYLQGLVIWQKIRGWRSRSAFSS